MAAEKSGGPRLISTASSTKLIVAIAGHRAMRPAYLDRNGFTGGFWRVVFYPFVIETRRPVPRYEGVTFRCRRKMLARREENRNRRCRPRAAPDLSLATCVRPQNDGRDTRSAAAWHTNVEGAYFAVCISPIPLSTMPNKLTTNTAGWRAGSREYEFQDYSFRENYRRGGKAEIYNAFKCRGLEIRQLTNRLKC